MEIYHKLKLYTEAEPANPNTKKPVSNMFVADAQQGRTGAAG